MSLRNRGTHRWSQRTLATGITALLIAGLSSWVASSAAQGADFGPCPDAFPVGELTAGMVGSGLTVERGTAPDPFTATVLGVIDDGIAVDLDLIIADTDSPAIQRAGGIWAGMSGSPVYAADGRLIGAVAYSLADGSSSIAGITPAADMKQVLSRATPMRAAKQVALPAALRQKLVASGAATAAQAAAGMTQLAIPVGVSGLGQTRLDAVSDRLQSRIPHMQVYSAGAAAIGDVGSPADIFPGSNFAAAISYGDLSFVGVGTTTAVCDGGTALAFGHPFLFSGQSSMSVHSATAILVQPGLFGGFKVANPGGVVGTLDQDRLAAIRGQLGPAPAAVPVDSTITGLDNGASRSGTTNVNVPDFIPDVAAFHLLNNLDRVADRIGGGTVRLRWVIEGTRQSGAPFTVDVSNMFANQFDASFESIFQPADHLFAIQGNPFEDAKITGVNFTGSISSAFGQYTLDKVLIRRPNGTFVPAPTDRPLRVEAGSQLNLRAVLLPFRSTTPVNADLSVVVPPDTAGGFGSVGVVGGSGEFFGDGDGDGSEPANFNELLAQLNDTAPNNSVNATLTVEKETSTGFIRRETHGRAVVDQVVQGEKFFPIQVVQPRRARPGVVAGNVWKLRSSLTAGPATQTFTFGTASARKLMADWDGNGSLTPAVFSDGTWRIRPNSSTTTITVNFGQAGDVAVAGDWDGDGKDTIGVYRAGRWLLRNSNSAGPADLDFTFGSAGRRPVTGDWNGDGVDTVGTFLAGSWSVRDQNSAGPATKTFTFGTTGDQPVVGDWDVDGRDEPGVYRSGRWLLRNSLSGGTPSKSFVFGAAGNRSVVWG
ncbi:MAG TPA: SpoIVB peptidase S55 domain-containing protein [Actinomycetes bacterium]|nr:SpoIVB peptidase S55 domain-containing protein [Actinomycetes bacterium]